MGFPNAETPATRVACGGGRQEFAQREGSRVLDTAVTDSKQAFIPIGDAVNSVIADLCTHQATWVARRCRLEPQVARAIASLAFSEGVD